MIDDAASSKAPIWASKKSPCWTPAGRVKVTEVVSSAVLEDAARKVIEELNGVDVAVAVGLTV